MLQAILFDLDGTLVDTDPLHFQIWQEILSRHGIDIDHPTYKATISGRQNPQIISDLLPHLSQSEAEQLAEDKEAQFRSQAAGLEPLPGLDRILQWITDQGLKTGVVTNAPRQNARFMLSVLKLQDYFKTVVLGEDMSAGKPDPAPYQFCLEQLQITPERTIVFEDSPSGIRSSVGAGIETIGVATTHAPEKLQKVGANRVITDFNDAELWQWLKQAT
ncbi:MAG: HAD family hydrolase [Microcoleaceae cyanobacterium]